MKYTLAELKRRKNNSTGFKHDSLNYEKLISYDLQRVKDQTPEICLAAVKQNGCALRFVKEQTKEICLAAVKQDRCALLHLKINL